MTIYTWRENRSLALTAKSLYKDVEEIEREAFAYSNIKYGYLPNCKGLRGSAFMCSEISYLKAPNCITIEVSCFHNYNQLRYVYIPKCENDRSRSLRQCTTKTICLPSVTRIERYAFRFCSNLENKLYHIMMARSYSYVALADEASLWYDLTRIQTLLSFL